MREKKKPSVSGTSRTIYFPVFGFMILASMLWDAVSGYLADGPDAPTVAQLVISVILFGGGCIFTAIVAVRTYRAEYAAYEEKMAAQKQEELAAPEGEEE